MNTYACWNKPREKGFWARDVKFNEFKPPEDGWVWVPDEMSKECRYDKTLEDPKCAGCGRAK